MNAPRFSDLLTVAELANKLNVGKKTAYRMLSPGGELSHLRVVFNQKTIRIPRDKLDEHLEQRLKECER